MFERLHQRKARCGTLHNDDHHDNNSGWRCSYNDDRGEHNILSTHLNCFTLLASRTVAEDRTAIIKVKYVVAGNP